MIIRINSDKSVERLSKEAEDTGLLITNTDDYSKMPEHIKGESGKLMIFYYNRVPIEKIDPLIEKLVEKWKRI